MPRFQKDRNIFISLPPTHTSLPALWSGACERCQTLGTPFHKMCRLILSCKTGTPHGLRKQVCTPVGFHSDFPAHAHVCPRMQGAFCVYVPCACSTCMFSVHVPYACSMCMLHMHVLYACSMCVLCTHVPRAHSVCMFHMHVPFACPICVSHMYVLCACSICMFRAYVSYACSVCMFIVHVP